MTFRDMKWYNKVTIGLIAVLAIVFIVGYILTPASTCYKDILGCEKCWSNRAKTVTELCPAGKNTCETEPYIEQHNVLVDVIRCACDKSAPTGYSNADLNTKIRSLYSNAVGYEDTVQKICDANNPVLTKWEYK